MARPRRRPGRRGVWVMAILLIVVLVGWGVARWRAGGSPAVDLGLGTHPTETDRAELERVLRSRTAPSEP